MYNNKDLPLFTGEKVICKHCGWPKRFYNHGTERLICNNCHKWIYKDKETEQKYKKKETLIKIKSLFS